VVGTFRSATEEQAVNRSSPQRENSNRHQRPSEDQRLLGIRTTLVLLLSLLTGGVVGVLWLLAGHPWPEALVTGASASGGALALFDQLISPEGER
jgi:hypothetical protein